MSSLFFLLTRFQPFSKLAEVIIVFLSQIHSYHYQVCSALTESCPNKQEAEALDNFHNCHVTKLGAHSGMLAKRTQALAKPCPVIALQTKRRLLSSLILSESTVFEQHLTSLYYHSRYDCLYRDASNTSNVCVHTKGHVN